ncbi:MAG: hypothetical protein L3J47_11645, partial [Sulfurovum sp.]|nr:hypothetical protein [Sulfurovum sp.]
MLIRSGKIQFLFWTAFFSVMVYLWIAWVGLQTFVLPDEKPMELPHDEIVLMFILYGLLSVMLMAGTVVAVMINNRYFRNFFGFIIFVAFGSLLVARSMLG